MAGRRRSRNSTPRGAWYWHDSVPFRPQASEANRAGHAASFKLRKPARVLQVGEDHIELYAAPVHSEFVLPIGVADVAAVLEKLPPRLLVGLKSVFLLGGSKRQISTDVWWGTYRPRTIYLYAAARKFLSWRSRAFPSHAQLRRVGSMRPHIRREGSHWHAEVDERELRDFYLYDVLLHEIGHHVDFRRDGYRRLRSRRKEERFAEWFAASWAKRLR